LPRGIVVWRKERKISCILWMNHSKKGSHSFEGWEWTKANGQEGLLKVMERSLLLVNRCHIREMNYLWQYRWRKISINNK
jgi:hypothetical protein